MSFTNIQEVIERSIYHTLRADVVELGYLPDIYQYDIENPDVTISRAEQKRYSEDMFQIKENMGFCIELFNYSTSQQRGKLKAPRIVIQTESFGLGNLGVEPAFEYEKVGGVYKKKKNSDILTDMFLTIRLIAKTTKQIRLLHSILINSLPRRGYIKRYTDTNIRPNNNLFVRFLTYADVSWNDEGIIEKIYRYEIPDVNEVELFTGEDIAPINDIMLQDIKFLDNE